MANKRILKKEIHAVTASLIGEYLLTSAFIPGVDKEKADDLLAQILTLRDEFLRRVGANGGKEPKMVAAYYRQLKQDYNTRIDEILSQFEALSKAE